MSFNVKRQLLGAAGAGGGGAYFISKWTTNYDADKRNTIHAVVDSSDNIYVDFDYLQSGTSYRTGLIKFDNAGNKLADRYIGNTLHREMYFQGNVFGGTWNSAIASNGNYHIVCKTNSYRANQVIIDPDALTVDANYLNYHPSGNGYGFQAASGNFYLIGAAGVGGPSYYTKYNSSGTQQYRKHIYLNNIYSDPSGCFFTGGHEDSSGNLYLGGTYAYSNYEAAVIKFNSSGTYQWLATRKFDNNNNLPAINVDSSGNVYAAGNIGLSNGTLLAYIVKWNSSGTFQWDYIHQYDDQQGCFQSIDFDSSGNVYVAGSQQEDGNGSFAGSWRNIGVVVKLNSSGTVQWQRGFANSTATSSVGQNKFTTVAIDSNDDMVLSTCESDGTNVKFYLLRLPNDGSLTGSYGSVGVKYDSTGYGDKAIGSSRTPSVYSTGTPNVSNLSSTLTATDISYSVTTQTV